MKIFNLTLLQSRILIALMTAAFLLGLVSNAVPKLATTWDVLLVRAIVATVVVGVVVMIYFGQKALILGWKEKYDALTVMWLRIILSGALIVALFLFSLTFDWFSSGAVICNALGVVLGGMGIGNALLEFYPPKKG